MTVLFVLGLWIAPQLAIQAPHHDLTGTVTNAITGEPINHALVQCPSPRSGSTLTGPDGRFEFSDIPEGQIILGVSKPGFFDANGRSGRAQLQPYRLTASTTDFSLKLLPAARIAGRLTDQDNEGIEQTTVFVLADSVSNGRRHWEIRSSTTTDDDGYYSVDDLYPGRYTVFVGGHVIPDSNWDGHLHVFAPAYYPGGAEISLAQPLDLQAGQDYRADFHLRSEPAFRVSGTFTGVPAGVGISYQFTNAVGQNIPWPLDIDSRHGKWVANALPAGTWNLLLTANENQGRLWRAAQEIVVGDSDISNLQLRLHSAASIPLTVNRAGEQHATQFVSTTLISLDPYAPHSLGLVLHGDPPVPSFDNVAAGKYRLAVGASGQCLDSAWYGNIDLLRNDLIVAEEVGTEPITINLRSDCSTFSPKMEGGGMAVITADGFNLPPLTVPAGTKATLSPGTYHVYAFTSADDLEYANPEVMRDFPSQEVELTPNQNLELTLKPVERKEN